MKHGQEQPLTLEALLDEDDPHLRLVNAPMKEWRDAHPCKCTGLVCICLDPRKEK